MVLVLYAVLAVMAVGAWAVVTYSAVRVLGFVPQGQKLRALGLLGRWQFGAVAHLGGEATIRHSNRYLKAMMFFLGAVVCAVVLWGLEFIDAQNGGSIEAGLSQLQVPPGIAAPWAA